MPNARLSVGSRVRLTRWLKGRRGQVVEVLNRHYAVRLEHDARLAARNRLGESILVDLLPTEVEAA